MLEVTFIEHSGFLVELEQHYLLFDYYKGEIPKLGKKPLYVFASHAHADHYQPMILDMGKQYVETKLILSDDIVCAGQKNITMVKPKQSYQIDDLHLTTYQSTDAGVAFLVAVEGKYIYHAGDLNWWHWEAENTIEENEAAKQAYIEEIHKLKGCSIDLAFLVLDPRQEDQYYLGFDAFMQIVKPKWAIPMHCWGDFALIHQLKQRPCAISYKHQIVDIHHKEEKLIWQQKR